jgi:hypothetical protein
LLRKQFFKNKCRVQFSLPVSIAAKAERVYLVGDFNGWSEQGENAKPMTKKRETFTASLDLPLNKEFQFRYHIYLSNHSEESEWHNDWHADKYIPAPYGGDNSTVITYKFS